MIRDRLATALQTLQSWDWKLFEELASTFCADLYPSFVTYAATSGDKGRDGVLWSPSEDPAVVLQYSVAADWRQKLRTASATIATEFPNARVLIFFSPLTIGPRADDVGSSIQREHGLFLQVRDQNWFLDRVESSASTRAAAERVARVKVDSISPDSVIRTKAAVLNDYEERAAVVYLGLQVEDTTQGRGLTKTSLDALVRAALRDTSPERRMSRTDIRSRVKSAIPGHNIEIDILVDAALERMTKRFVNHYGSEDEFCLRHSERERIATRLQQFDAEALKLKAVLGSQIVEAAEAHGIKDILRTDDAEDRLSAILEQILLRRGELFATAVRQGRTDVCTTEEIKDVVVADVATKGNVYPLGKATASILATAAESTLARPTKEILDHLSVLGNSYVLFSFLRATPNVQKSLVKAFSHGDVWLDTSAVLPLFAETLLDADERRFSRMIAAARSVDVCLYVTPGVVEEIDRHMNRCVAYARHHGPWEGRIPFLITAFAVAGRTLGSIATWLEEFRGASRPEDDIADSLQELFGIEVRGLADEAATASQELHAATQELWLDVREKQRTAGQSIDPITARKLANHDVENYLGVIQRRHLDGDNPLGFSTWWLTLDRSAYDMHRRIADRTGSKAPHSPVMSADFLLQYLSVDRLRTHPGVNTDHNLPLLLDLAHSDFVSKELLETAHRLNDEYSDMAPRRRRRVIRDAMDAHRQNLGDVAKGGLANLDESLRKAQPT